MLKRHAFVAYPSAPSLLAECIRAAVKAVNAKNSGIQYSIWEENDIAGRPLTAPIFESINKSDLLVADVTRLNFNVTYEVGYSIGAERRVLLIRNRSSNHKTASVSVPNGNRHQNR